MHPLAAQCKPLQPHFGFTVDLKDMLQDSKKNVYMIKCQNKINVTCMDLWDTKNILSSFSYSQMYTIYGIQNMSKRIPLKKRPMYVEVQYTKSLEQRTEHSPVQCNQTITLLPHSSIIFH